MTGVLMSVAPDDIVVGKRFRDIDEDWVVALAEAIRQAGRLTQPPITRFIGDKMHLIVGGHRLAAAKLAGLEEIQVIAHDASLSDDEAELMEVDENLIRYELTPYDRAAFLAKRKAIYERLHPETRGGVAGGKARQGSANVIFTFADATAEKVGLSKRTIQRAVTMFERLTPETRRRLRGTWILQKEGELNALSKLGPDDQSAALDLMLRKEEPAPSVTAAKAVITGKTELAPEDKLLRSLINSWDRAGKSTRDKFLRHINGGSA